MLVGIVMILPVFATGVDWVRWWVIIAFDLGVVFCCTPATSPKSMSHRLGAR